MTQAIELLPVQPVTAQGALPSRDLVEIVQRLVSDLRAQDTAIAALEAKLAAIAAVTAPTGGATIDSQSRTAIAAIIAAAT
jgi:hypothetical protein